MTARGTGEHTGAMSDAKDVGRTGDHHGQDGGREEIWAGDVQRGTAGDPAQTAPMMSQNDAGAGQKIEGILVQTRADVAGHDDVDPRSILAQRLKEAGIAVTDEEFEAVAVRLNG